ncbi:turripeptide Lol9.1-like isoform X2 [Clavelina lepadiformis]|uniref:turripeptide Lol9.1-like isoform X2 n=1 Tax=Clavelina lepadiformis TaxID=159417 RepID=UPI0040423684
MKTTYLSLILSSMLVCACVGNPVQRCPEICPAVYDPVCGNNGVIFSNYCTLGVAACNSPWEDIREATDPTKTCPDCLLCAGGGIHA